MATQETRNNRIANESLPAVEAGLTETVEQDGKPGRFRELLTVLSGLSSAFDRTFVIVGVILIGAIATSYWAAYYERSYILAGAVVIFGLAMLAWTVVTFCRLWVVIRGGVKWWQSRNGSGSDGFKGSETG